jgi:hypothetical protein
MTVIKGIEYPPKVREGGMGWGRGGRGMSIWLSAIKGIKYQLKVRKRVSFFPAGHALPPSPALGLVVPDLRWQTQTNGLILPPTGPVSCFGLQVRASSRPLSERRRRASQPFPRSRCRRSPSNSFFLLAGSFPLARADLSPLTRSLLRGMQVRAYLDHFEKAGDVPLYDIMAL